MYREAADEALVGVAAQEAAVDCGGFAGNCAGDRRLFFGEILALPVSQRKTTARASVCEQGNDQPLSPNLLPSPRICCGSADAATHRGSRAATDRVNAG